MNTPLWQPSQAQIDGAEITRFRKKVEADWNVSLGNSRGLWKFSVTELEKFWTSVWDDAGIIAETRGERALVDADRMPGARWFPDARLSFAENMLRHRGDGEAMVFNGENRVSRRISFDDGAEVMDVDFSNFTFYNSADVHAFYDHIEVRLETTGMRWFFLVNMENCKIYDEAWVSYAMRGKALNQKWSMGSVRYATGSDTEETIRMRAESQSFRPNVRVTREDALARLDEMKREMA